MAAKSKVVTVVLRALQLICAVVMVGIASDYIANNKAKDIGHLSRFVFTDAVSFVSAFFALIWLIPFSSNYMNWYIDAIVCLFSGGMAGWLIYSSEKKCGKINETDIKATVHFKDKNASDCTKWKALYIFAIISAALWLLSAIVGFFWVRKHIKTAKAKGGRRSRH